MPSGPKRRRAAAKKKNGTNTASTIPAEVKPVAAVELPVIDEKAETAPEMGLKDDKSKESQSVGRTESMMVMLVDNVGTKDVPVFESVVGKSKEAEPVVGNPKEAVSVVGKPKASKEAVSVAGKPKEAVSVAGKPKEALSVAGKPKEAVSVLGKPKETVSVGKTKETESVVSMAKEAEPVIGKLKEAEPVVGEPKEAVSVLGKPKEAEAVSVVGKPKEAEALPKEAEAVSVVGKPKEAEPVVGKPKEALTVVNEAKEAGTVVNEAKKACSNDQTILGESLNGCVNFNSSAYLDPPAMAVPFVEKGVQVFTERVLEEHAGDQLESSLHVPAETIKPNEKAPVEMTINKVARDSSIVEPPVSLNSLATVNPVESISQEVLKEPPEICPPAVVHPNMPVLDVIAKKDLFHVVESSDKLDIYNTEMVARLETLLKEGTGVVAQLETLLKEGSAKGERLETLLKEAICLLNDLKSGNLV